MKSLERVVFGLLVPAVFLLPLGLQSCSTQPPAQRAPVTATVAPGNTAAGKRVYETECAQCHAITPGNNRKGPQLDRIYYSRAASLADYQERYSSALKKSGWTWNRKNLDQYIRDPDRALPGGKMLYEGLANPVDRQNLIAYLSTLRSPGSDQSTAKK